jgi:hypothetical protein
LSALDTADRQEGEVAEAKSIRLKDKLARLKQQMQHLREMEIAVQAAPDQQISLTDPDARAMATNGKGTGIVGYNVQTAVAIISAGPRTRSISRSACPWRHRLPWSAA